jgi:hypothetical protein
MPKSSQSDDFYYEGFSTPNGTIVPDDVFDILAPRLTEAELRVLLYIVRRTFGFKKASDRISLTQMVSGVRTQDGRVLDTGTGMSRSAVWRGIQGLLKKGILRVEKALSPQGDQDVNVYSLRFKEGVVLQENHPSSPKEPRVVLQENPQQTVKQETVKQQHPLTPSQDHTTNEPLPSTTNVVVVYTSLLKDRGVHPKTASALARKYPGERIQEKVEILDYLVSIKSPLVRKNPAGWLRKAIEEDYYPPKQYLEKKHREEQRQQMEEERKHTEQEWLRERAKELAQPPEERARRWLQVWEAARAQINSKPLSPEEREQRLRHLVEKFTREREAFFGEHPELAPAKRGRQAAVSEAISAPG